MKYDEHRFLSNKAAEMVKLASNCIKSVKISASNEIYDLCQVMGIDYSQVFNMLRSDYGVGFIGLQVPGHDGLRGFGGTCFPKDLFSLCNIQREKGCGGMIFQNSLYRNFYIDRKERDYLIPDGRKMVKDSRPQVLVVLDDQQ